MMEWILFISVGVLLIIAGYFFLRIKLEEIREAAFEDEYDEYAEEESVWAESYEEAEEPVWEEEYEEAEPVWDEGYAEEAESQRAVRRERQAEPSSAWDKAALQPIWSGNGRSAEAARRKRNQAAAEAGRERSRAAAEGRRERSQAAAEGRRERSLAAADSRREWNQAAAEGRRERSLAAADSRREWNQAAAEGRRERSLAAADSRREWNQAVGGGRRRRRRNNRIRVKKALRRACVLLAALGLTYQVLPYMCVKRELNMDTGMAAPGVEDFLNWGNQGASLVSGVEKDTILERAGDYDFVIQVYGKKVSAVLHVKAATPVAVYVKDNSDVVTQGVNSTPTPVGNEGNTSTVGTVLKDTEPPVIQGVKELTMTAGASISYKKGVTVTDNFDQNVKLNVDTSGVNTDKPGDYTILYSAVDSAGNRAAVATVLHVLPMTVDTVTEENVNAEADKILASILTESMSQYDQAKAIYDWCHSKIAYSDGTPKTNWVQGAYRGLVDRKGDCYVYAATAKCLLTRAGIENMDIERIPSGNSMHYWNLIDIGEGWYHFDTCRRKDGSTFFYKTDAEIKEYSDAHDGTHNYDRSLYPEIN